jgi:hypothetical protein
VRSSRPLLGVLLLLFVRPAQAQDDVEELLDEIRALGRGLSLGGSTADLEGVVASELAGVEAAAGMTATAPIGTRIVSREEAHDHVARLVAEQLPPERLRAMEQAWKALGLLAPDAALGPAIQALYADQAGGFYDAASKSMVLLGDVPMLFQVPVVRHELVHALQDQTWNLATWLGDAGQDEDRAAAVQAVLEGHATDVMNRVTMASLGLGSLGAGQAAELAELLGTDAAGLEDLAGSALDAGSLAGFLPAEAPGVLRVQLVFPYSVGATFVAGYRKAHPEDPGCQGLYRRPPRSSAEVLDPSLWESGTFLPEYTSPGINVPGFSVTWTSSLGRLISWILLTGQADASAGDPDGGRWGVSSRDRSVVLGSGWRGDRVAVLVPLAHPPGTQVPAGHVVAWVARWRDGQEAAAVATALRRRLPSATIAVHGDRTQTVVGASEGAAKAIREAMEGWR